MRDRGPLPESFERALLIFLKLTLTVATVLQLSGCASTPAPAAPDKPQPATAAANMDHMHMHRGMAGAPDGADICKQYGSSPGISSEQQAVINHRFASRDHRMQHALWHAIRGGNDADLFQIAKTFPEWKNPHPICPAPGALRKGAKGYLASGEDFLYMHHHMVEALRTDLAAAKLPCIAGWTGIPDPQEWPIPTDDPTAELQDAKSARTYSYLVEWDKHFSDPTWLKTVSLSQLGWALEFTVHNNLHMRYAADTPPVGDSNGANLPNPDAKFDDPAYNWLADPYGAAVNPLFWKIHGYVENVLDQWLQANGKNGQKLQLRASCAAGVDNCYAWKGDWVGVSVDPDIAARTSAVRGVASQSDGNDWQNIRFNQARLAHQRIGVIVTGNFGAPPTRGAGTFIPNDPFEAAKQFMSCR